MLVAGGFVIIGLSYKIKKDAKIFHSEKGLFIQQKLNQILDNLYVQIIFSSLTEIDHLRKKSKNAEGKELKIEIEKFIKGIVSHLNNKKKLIELKEEFEIIKNKLVNDSSIYAHIRDITKKIVNIVQEHDEIKNDYDEAYEIELQISKKYLYLSYILMALGITIVVFAILNCSVNALLLGAFNSMILVLIILLGYMLLVMSVALFRNKQELDELHKKIDDVEQDSLDISSIND